MVYKKISILFAGAEGIKADALAATYGGTAGEQYDPCYHLDCDTFYIVSYPILNEIADVVAVSTFMYSMSTRSVNSVKSSAG